MQLFDVSCKMHHSKIYIVQAVPYTGMHDMDITFKLRLISDLLIVTSASADILASIYTRAAFCKP